MWNPRKEQDFASRSALASGQLTHWAIWPCWAFTNTAFGSCLQVCITPRSSLPRIMETAHPAQNPVREAWRRKWSVSLSEAMDPERHGLVMALWEARLEPLDAQKLHLDFLRADRIEEWDSADAQQLSGSSDPRWRPDCSSLGAPRGLPVCWPTRSSHNTISTIATLNRNRRFCKQEPRGRRTLDNGENNSNSYPALEPKHSWLWQEQPRPPRRSKLKIKGNKVLPASLQIQEAKKKPQPGTGYRTPARLPPPESSHVVRRVNSCQAEALRLTHRWCWTTSH